jgi:diacylglycerol kinase family enzyme
VRRAAVLYNPVAGAGNAEAIARRAEALLMADHWTVERLATRSLGGAEPLARQHARAVDLLVVVGGDGSIREAVSGLGSESRRVNVAVLPCGNANVVARELGIPLDLERALGLLASGTPKAVDLARANGELFLAMVGIGWDARTVRHLSQLRRHGFGRWWYRVWADSAYLVAGLMALFVFRRDRLQLVVDGASGPRRYCAAMIANFRCYGKGWTMVPDADATSGRLHFQARKRFGFPFVAWQLIAAFVHGRLPGFISDYGEGRRIQIRADRPFPVQIDGDDRGSFAELEVEIDPGAARFIVPPTAPGL